MYALVYFTKVDSNGKREWDVVPVSDIIDSGPLNIHEIYKVKWDNRCYDAELLRLAGNAKDFEGIVVNPDGSVIDFPTSSHSSSSEIAQRKKRTSQAKKEVEAAQAATSQKFADAIMLEKPVFASSHGASSRGASSSSTLHSPSSDNGPCHACKYAYEALDNIIAQARAIQEELKGHIETHSTSQSPSKVRKRILTEPLRTSPRKKQATLLSGKVDDVKGNTSSLVNFEDYKRDLSDRVELWPKSGVFINKAKRYSIAKGCAKSSSQIIREVLRELFGKDNLKLMSARGNHNTTGVPESVWNATHAFAAWASSSEVDHGEMTKVINNMISSLKFPRVKDSHDSGDLTDVQGEENKQTNDGKGKKAADDREKEEERKRKGEEKKRKDEERKRKDEERKRKDEEKKKKRDEEKKKKDEEKKKKDEEKKKKDEEKKIKDDEKKKKKEDGKKKRQEEQNGRKEDANQQDAETVDVDVEAYHEALGDEWDEEERRKEEEKRKKQEEEQKKLEEEQKKLEEEQKKLEEDQKKEEEDQKKEEEDQKEQEKERKRQEDDRKNQDEDRKQQEAETKQQEEWKEQANLSLGKKENISYSEPYNGHHTDASPSPDPYSIYSYSFHPPNQSNPYFLPPSPYQSHSYPPHPNQPFAYPHQSFAYPHQPPPHHQPSPYLPYAGFFPSNNHYYPPCSDQVEEQKEPLVYSSL